MNKPSPANDAITNRLTPEIIQEVRKGPTPSSLDHIRRMTDDTGLLQHASFTLPNRIHGYCTDDNARGVVAMIQYYSMYPDPEALRLLNIYLSFIFHAQQPDGMFYNLMSYDRRWLSQEPDHDGLSRSLWAIGTAIAKPVMPEMVDVLRGLFERSVEHVNELSPRSRAYAIFGMRQYMVQFPDNRQIRNALTAAADFLVDLLSHADGDWSWFEDILCYDNAAMPHALFEAYMLTGHEPYLKAAVRSCDFLLSHTYNGKHFSFIGCNGWFCRGKTRAQFDQQPLDAMETVRMLRTAFTVTGNRLYRQLQTKAFNWFLGENDLSMPLYDSRTGGCFDGLMQDRVNLNQGAESTLSFILAFLNSPDEGHCVQTQSSRTPHIG